MSGLAYTIMITAWKDGLSVDDNTARLSELKRSLIDRNVLFAEVEGCYNGQTEMSLLIPAMRIEDALKICEKYDQECFLLLDQGVGGYLIYADKNKPDEFIGYLKASDNKPNSDYTRIGKIYYTFIKE